MKTNAGNDQLALVLGGGGDVPGITGTATSTTATSLTNTGASFTTDAYVGRIIVAGTVYGVITTNSGTVITVDRWYNPSCMDERTEILTGRGWLTLDELSLDDEVLGYDPDQRVSHWERLTGINIHPAYERTLIAMRHRSHSSLSTADHRWPIESADYRVAKTITTAEVNSKSSFFRAAPVANVPQQAKYEDAFVELVGWFCTEGNVGTSHGGPSNYIKIHQSMVNPDHVDRIRHALTTLFGPDAGPFPRTGRTLPTTPMWRETAPSSRPHERVFVLNTVAGALLQEVAPNRVMRPEFVAALTRAQLELLWATWLAGDGCDEVSIGQKDRARLEPLQMALALRGVGSSLRETAIGWELHAYRSNRFTMQSRNATIEEVPHSGRVWCPTTESGYWLARREGKTFITGNSPGGSAGSTPSGTSAYVILNGGAPAMFHAITANSTSPAASDTTLASEITTAGGGLVRKIATYAHTTGAASYTLTTVFTANGSDSLPVTIAKMANFTGMVSGRMVFETLVSPTATLSASGDSLTLTATVSL